MSAAARAAWWVVTGRLLEDIPEQPPDPGCPDCGTGLYLDGCPEHTSPRDHASDREARP